MNRSVTIERVYNLADYVGNYNTLRLSDQLAEIPENLMLNVKFIEKVRLLQFVNLERDYRRYLLLLSKLEKADLESGLEMLDKLKTSTMDELKTIISENKGE